jgi:LPXTG-site transpeptidase (sortase) family protein
MGDAVIYETGGVDYIYAIKSMETVAPSEVQKLYVNDGRQLLLVTCANWDYLAFRYTNRVIVQARLVKQELAQ